MFAISATAQKKNAGYQYHIRRASSNIVIDGVGDEPGWIQTDSAVDFHMVLPMDTSKATIPTVVRMAYDDKNLYILAVCYTNISGPYMVESLKRDFNFQKNDNLFFLSTPLTPARMASRLARTRPARNGMAVCIRAGALI